MSAKSISQINLVGYISYCGKPSNKPSPSPSTLSNGATLPIPKASLSRQLCHHPAGEKRTFSGTFQVLTPGHLQPPGVWSFHSHGGYPKFVWSPPILETPSWYMIQMVQMENTDHVLENFGVMIDLVKL